MRDLPILFSGAMVRGLLREVRSPGEGKTQTRRVLDQHVEGMHLDRVGPTGWQFTGEGGAPRIPIRLKYSVGDRLWVRESIGRRTASFMGIEATNGVEEAFYVADDEPVLNAHEFNLCPWWKSKQALPSIHMPRWASRLTLTVTDVRVQRLQEISEADAIAEGVTFERHHGGPDLHACDGIRAVEAYWSLWDSLNVKRGFGWEANPWVVAVTFTVERRNIDEAA